MNVLDSFRMLARYNQAANTRLYESVSHLDENAYLQARKVSFGSVHALLNHMLLGDQIWMARFAGGGGTTPALHSILFDRFADLQKARLELDRHIELFFEKADDAFLVRPVRYTNSQGKDYNESAPVAVLHFFNHQTHHRGQVHVLLSQADVKPPSLDLHRILNP